MYSSFENIIDKNKALLDWESSIQFDIQQNRSVYDINMYLICWID